MSKVASVLKEYILDPFIASPTTTYSLKQFCHQRKDKISLLFSDLNVKGNHSCVRNHREGISG